MCQNGYNKPGLWLFSLYYREYWHKTKITWLKYELEPLPALIWKGMFRCQLHEELSHEMVMRGNQIYLKSWWGSCLGLCLPIVIVLDMKSLYGNSVMVEIMPYSFIVAYCLCHSSSLKHDDEVISLLMITDWNPSMCRVRDVLNLLHYSYSRAGPWCHVSEWQRGHIQTV